VKTLLSDTDISLKEEIYSFLVNNFKNKKDIDLKSLWKSLYKNSFISENNSFTKNVLLTESVCKFKPGLGLFLLTQFSCIEIVKTYGSENLKAQYLSKLISGESIASFALTEPNAGSDVTMIETTAKEDKRNSWIINGHKIWSSNAPISDLVIFFAQTKEHKNKTGITCFITESNLKEIKIAPSTPKLGVQISPSSEILIKDLKVNKEQLAGNIGDGIKIALGTITFGRIYCAAQATGLLEGILEEAVKHSTKRNQFGKAISDNQAIKWYLADMTKDLDACKMLLYKACWAEANKKEELNKLSSMAKYFCSSKAQEQSRYAVQILGGKGLNEDSYVAEAYRDSKVLEIYEGTNEIQKLIICKELQLN